MLTRMQVPAAVRTMRVLEFLGRQPRPVPLQAIAQAVGMPRSSAYHLLSSMVEEGFVMHLPDDRTFGLGPRAFEIAHGYVRQAPLRRLARAPVAGLAEATGHWAHLAVLHGRDVLYVLEERPLRRPSLVTDVGVRLPASATASGRAILADLPPNEVHALFPDSSAFSPRHCAGPRSPGALRRLLVQTRAHGYAVERDEVTSGLASVALSVADHNGRPVAAITLTHDLDLEVDDPPPALLGELQRAARTVQHRLTGEPRRR